MNNKEIYLKANERTQFIEMWESYCKRVRTGAKKYGVDLSRMELVPEVSERK